MYCARPADRPSGVRTAHYPVRPAGTRAGFYPTPAQWHEYRLKAPQSAAPCFPSVSPCCCGCLRFPAIHKSYPLAPASCAGSRAPVPAHAGIACAANNIGSVFSADSPASRRIPAPHVSSVRGRFRFAVPPLLCSQSHPGRTAALFSGPPPGRSILLQSRVFYQFKNDFYAMIGIRAPRARCRAEKLAYAAGAGTFSHSGFLFLFPADPSRSPFPTFRANGANVYPCIWPCKRAHIPRFSALLTALITQRHFHGSRLLRQKRRIAGYLPRR